MRYLIVDHYYPGVLNRFYQHDQAMQSANYADQYAGLVAMRFGEAAFEADALKRLGHWVDHFIVNAYPLQRAWMYERGTDLRRGRSLRLRRGLVPWLADDGRWMWSALRAQVVESQPDVVLVASVDLLPGEVVKDLRQRARLVVGIIAADLPDVDLGGYSLMVSSVPALVQQFREAGLDAEELALAFEPRLVTEFNASRDIEISFVGAFTVSHPNRRHIVEAVAASVPLEIWTADRHRIRADLRNRVRGPAFGREMYSVLARSRIALNTHARVAKNYVNNLRLYEATGMGAMLLTDSGTNLRNLFDVGREVVAYTDTREAVELARYYVDHPEEASRIAALGQARTLREHTWDNRMAELDSKVRQRT